MIQFRCRKHRDPVQRLWQVSMDDGGHQAGRPIEGLLKEGLRPGGWVAEKRELKPGLYCQHCLSEGTLDAIPDYDELDIEEAGLKDTPHVGLTSADFEVDGVWSSLRTECEPLIAAESDRSPAPARTDDRFRTDARLDSALRDTVLKILGDRDLYSHQAEAINGALEGRDVVVETATASGKSLCYWIPIANRLLQDQSATALYISPLNALAEDQLDAIDRLGQEPTFHYKPGSYKQYARAVRIGSRSFSVARYHGGIDSDVRRWIRKSQPRVLITNPDMLHFGILPHHEKLWTPYFSNLRYIVIDELHVYKGMFGANFANILRRLLRLTLRYGIRPQIIACSASIGNPAELFTAVTGRKSPVLVPASANGAPIRRQKRVVLDLARTSEAMPTVTKDLMAATVGQHRARTIAFMRSISEVDQVYRYVAGDLARNLKGIGKSTVREYKREIPVTEKARVTADLKSGATLGVISTNALQLGIDIGDLSVAVIAKFPGSKAAFFQQAGRVGRNGDSLVFFLADRSPLDQWFAQRPEELLHATSEVVFINPDHRETVISHLRCAAEEFPLHPDRDREFWGDDLPSLLEELAARGGMSSDGREVLVIRKAGDTARDVSIRSLGFECVVRDEGGDEVARPDVIRAMRRYHKYARFQIQERAYEVSRLSVNWNEREAEAVARKLDRLDYTTASVIKTECTVLEVDETKDLDDCTIERGNVRFKVCVDSYYKIPTGGASKPEYQPLGAAAPPHYELDTDGLWVRFQGEAISELPAEDRQSAVKSAVESLRIAAALLCSTDPEDIGTHVHVNSDSSGFIGFLADNEPGGNGLTRHVFGRLADLLDGALRILRDCPHCREKPESRGCPGCVTTPWGGDEDVNRIGGIALLTSLRGRLG